MPQTDYESMTVARSFMAFCRKRFDFAAAP